jgi:hypothetical protein
MAAMAEATVPPLTLGTERNSRYSRKLLRDSAIQYTGMPVSRPVVDVAVGDGLVVVVGVGAAVLVALVPLGVGDVWPPLPHATAVTSTTTAVPVSRARRVVRVALMLASLLRPDPL